MKHSKGTIHKFCAAEGLFGMAAGPKKEQKGRPLAIAPAMYTKLKRGLDTLLRVDEDEEGRWRREGGGRGARLDVACGGQASRAGWASLAPP